MCGIHDIVNIENPLGVFHEIDMEKMVEQVFTGKINTKKLSIPIYEKTSEALTKGVYSGYGKTLSSTVYGSTDYEALTAMRENVYIFSGAKNYQCTREMEQKLKEINKALIKKNEIVKFEEFKKQAKKIFGEYNETYLNVEYNMAIAQAKASANWKEYEKTKEVLPNLTYMTVGDNRVRPEHEAMNKITRPINDKFWDKYYPPNGWNCRCFVIQTDDEVTNLRGFKPTDVPEIFQFNSGKENIIFSPKHPYFDVSKKDKSSAKRNFNLPLP